MFGAKETSLTQSEWPSNCSTSTQRFCSVLLVEKWWVGEDRRSASVEERVAQTSLRVLDSYLYSQILTKLSQPAVANLWIKGVLLSVGWGTWPGAVGAWGCWAETREPGRTAGAQETALQPIGCAWTMSTAHVPSSEIWGERHDTKLETRRELVKIEKIRTHCWRLTLKPVHLRMHTVRLILAHEVPMQ